MCRDNEYGCHATAAAGGLVWTGVVTNLAVTPATEEPVTRTPSTGEGIEAWGIKFLSVRLDVDFYVSPIGRIGSLHRNRLRRVPPQRRFPHRATRRMKPKTREQHLRLEFRVTVDSAVVPLLVSWSAASQALRCFVLEPSCSSARRSLPPSQSTTLPLPANIPTSLLRIPCISLALLVLHTLLRRANISPARWPARRTNLTPSRNTSSKPPLSWVREYSIFTGWGKRLACSILGLVKV